MDPHQEGLILALFVQSTLYGIYLAFSGSCLRNILFGEEHKLRKNIRRIFLLISLSVLFLSTTDLGIFLRATLTAFSGKDVTYNDLDAANTAIRGLVMVITSGVLIYRCWKLYSQSWRIIYILSVPWLVSLGCLIARVVGITILEQVTSAVLFLFCNVAITACVSVAVIYRTFGFSKIANMQNLRPPPGTGWWIFLESGFIYALTSGSVLVAAAVPDSQATISLILDAVNFSTACVTLNAALANVDQQRDERNGTANTSTQDREIESRMVAQGSYVASPSLVNEYSKHVGLVLFM